MSRSRALISLLIAALLLASCAGDDPAAVVSLPTATLAPIVSHTPRSTATPFPSNATAPTETYTPSATVIPPTPSDTPTPTVTPPIRGSVNSLQSINVRSGPGVTFETIEALRPATRLQVLGQNTDGSWLNIRMEDGREGWVSASLIRLEPTVTPVPSLTPSPDMTLMALGTPLPTALFGGGTVTPTPPRSLSGATPTAVDPASLGTPQVAVSTPLNAATAIASLQLPNIEAINQTATALAGGGIAAPAATLPGLGGPTGGPFIFTASPTAPAPQVTASVQRVNVLAYCDDRRFGSPPPQNLAAGSSIQVFWVWEAHTRQQVEDHINAAVYEVQVNGRSLPWRPFAGTIRELPNGHFSVSWFVPVEQPLERGETRITYRVSWTRAIFDGDRSYGPGTGILQETGSCTFTVR